MPIDPGTEPLRGQLTAARIPRVIWVLGLVSLCMDISSEMIHALLPVFLVSVAALMIS